MKAFYLGFGGTLASAYFYGQVFTTKEENEILMVEADGEGATESVDPTDFGEGCKKPPPENFQALVLGAAEEFSVDPWLLAVTVYRESACNPKALGTSGEIGLAQVLPRVWLEELREAEIIYEEEDLWDSETNLRAGAYILKQHYEDTGGSLYRTFRKYNGSGEPAKLYAKEQVQEYQRWNKHSL